MKLREGPRRGRFSTAGWLNHSGYFSGANYAARFFKVSTRPYSLFSVRE
jgi:hypothetical protein